MTRHLVPKYKYVAIARDVTQLLRLSPALEWWQVRDYYEPSLLAKRQHKLSDYDTHTRLAIARAIDREMRYLHAR